MFVVFNAPLPTHSLFKSLSRLPISLKGKVKSPFLDPQMGGPALLPSPLCSLASHAPLSAAPFVSPHCHFLVYFPHRDASQKGPEIPGSGYCPVLSSVTTGPTYPSWVWRWNPGGKCMLGKQSTTGFTAASAPILFYVTFTPLSTSHHHLLLITLFRALDSLQIALYLSLSFLIYHPTP